MTRSCNSQKNISIDHENALVIKPILNYVPSVHEQGSGVSEIYSCFVKYSSTIHEHVELTYINPSGSVNWYNLWVFFYPGLWGNNPTTILLNKTQSIYKQYVQREDGRRNYTYITLREWGDPLSEAIQMFIFDPMLKKRNTTDKITFSVCKSLNV
jgi:hypothetical protein